MEEGCVVILHVCTLEPVEVAEGVRTDERHHGTCTSREYKYREPMAREFGHGT